MTRVQRRIRLRVKRCRPTSQKATATMTSSVSSRATAAPIAPLPYRCCVLGMSAGLTAGLSTAAPAMTQVHAICRFWAIRTAPG